MARWRRLKQPPWRTLVALAVLALLAGVAWLAWSPGLDLRDGRHDRGTNGVWLGHGWLGADDWYTRWDKEAEKPRYRGADPPRRLAELLREHGVTDLYPHVAPTQQDGTLPPVDPDQVRLFLDATDDLRVIAWVGGAWGKQAFPDVVSWRRNMATSVGRLLRDHPRLAGVQLNIEPCPSGSQAFLRLLEEVREQMPPDRILSVAAYPPPTAWHPYPEVHWEEDYFREVAARADHLAVMMYDTALKEPKLYEALMARWTREVLAWSGDAEVLLGVPTYDDAGVGYHHPEAENLEHALAGVHAGLEEYGPLPDRFSGVAIYCEWETDAAEWALFDQRWRGVEVR